MKPPEERLGSLREKCTPAEVHHHHVKSFVHSLEMLPSSVPHDLEGVSRI